MNRRVDIREDIKHYQDTLSYASSKVDNSGTEYMLPSDMNLKIKTGSVGYNNKILISDEKVSLGKNVEVNSLVLELASIEEPVIPVPKDHPSHGVTGEAPPSGAQPRALWAHKAVAQQTHAHELAKKPTHEDEKLALVLFLTGGFVIWNIFR